MGEIHKLFNQSDRETIHRYLGNQYLFDVFQAYEIALGSPQILAYERNIIKAIIDTYLSSDEKSQRAFCDYLEFGVSKKTRTKDHPNRSLEAWKVNLETDAFQPNFSVKNI